MEQKKNTRAVPKKHGIRRLLVANILAALLFVTVAVVTLWALGLLDSIIAFIF